MKLSTTTFLPLAAVAFLSSFTSASPDTSSLESRTGNFKWSWGGCDLQKGGPSTTPAYPTDWHSRGLSCGDDWYYHSTKKFCVPRNDPGTASPTSSCSSDKPWDSSNKCCKNKCSGTEFYFLGKDICLPTAVPSSVPSCPTGKTCPSGWIYNSKGYCVPKTSSFSPTPSCSVGSCDKDTYLCNTCKSTEFWFAAKEVCLPNTPPAASTCPGGKVCPANWYYTSKGYCAPKSSTTSTTPSCTSGTCDATTFLCNSCKSSEFWFAAKEVCLPNTPPAATVCPGGKVCPANWYYTSKGYCAPKSSTTSTTPSCTSGVCDATTFLCNSCKSSEFWFAAKSVCLPNSPPAASTCPGGKVCPTNWYYTSKGYCAPKTPSTSTTPSCTSGVCDATTFLCNSCKSSEFWFAAKSVCLPNSPPAGSTCPGGKVCPVNWYYTSKGYCAPKTPSTSTTPSCTSGTCDTTTFLCNSCRSSEFWFAAKEVCLPNTPPAASTCPGGKVCPVNWYYTSKGYCAPKTPSTSTTPSCTSGSCDSTTFLCSSCTSKEFWWDSGNGFKGCTPNGGPTSGSPPSGSNCITRSGNRKWHTGYKCCVPTAPSLPTVPTCSSGNWNHGSQCCIPGPVASGTTHNNRRRAHKQVVVSLPLDGRIDPARCPNNLTACPLGAADWECLNPLVELTSCGGCASTGAGQNCLLIANSLSVTCTSGSCNVLSCRTGLAPSLDGKSCV